jgi:Ni/Co efflux regulator RcnB
MNKLACSLIIAVGFGSLPVANAEESAAVAVSGNHASAHRVLTRKRHHHKHHHHKHHRHHHKK